MLLKWTNVGTVRARQSEYTTNLGVVSCTSCVQGDDLELEPAVQVQGDDTLEGWDDALHRGDVWLLEI